jgi:RNA polymerase sigma factor, sigma-70 family
MSLIMNNGMGFNSAMNKREQFTASYEQSFEYVYSFVFARTAGDEQLTEDIVQDTFAAAWQSYDRFDRRSSYKTWICAIAKNKLYESYRKKISSEKIQIAENEEYVDYPDSFDLEGIVLENETRLLVLGALNKLNSVYRYTLIMKYIDGSSVKEMAKILGRTPKAIDGVLQRAKDNFIKEYMQLGGNS